MSANIRRETPHVSANGYLALVVGVLAVAIGIWLTGRTATDALPAMAGVAGSVLIAIGIFVCAGLYMLQPNETAVLTLFGRYIGTDRGEGLRWAFPLYRKHKLTVRARNLNIPILKVNDKRGNPVEVAAAVVWRVKDTAQALFEVDNFERYVAVQAEAALRHLAAQYAYDEGEDLTPGEMTLRGGAAEVALALSNELTARFEAAGVETLDAKLTHLAYAPEIAQVMLRRQQAQAIISAPRPHRPRRRVDGGRRPEGTGRARHRRPRTPNARRRWSAICWWCCVRTAMRSPSSMRARCTTEP
jgi:regulator of protease activity HflC (stomatin/prohibitin superfamily)